MTGTLTVEYRLGDMLVELLVTDTVGWEVFAATERTITVRRAARGDTLRREKPGGPYPVVYDELVPDEGGRTRTLRLRKDGTFRIGRSGNPLRHAPRLHDKPYSVTDYRY